MTQSNGYFYSTSNNAVYLRTATPPILNIWVCSTDSKERSVQIAEDLNYAILDERPTRDNSPSRLFLDFKDENARLKQKLSTFPEP